MACKGELFNVYRLLARKETYGRPSGRRDTVLKLILNNIISGYVVWVYVAQCRVN